MCPRPDSPRFDGGGKKGLRTMVFILLASTSVVPSLHFGLLYGADKFAEVVDIFWSVVRNICRVDGFPHMFIFFLHLPSRLFQVSCPLYLIGAAIFVFKVPERWFPGKFDIWVRVGKGCVWEKLSQSLTACLSFFSNNLSLPAAPQSSDLARAGHVGGLCALQGWWRRGRQITLDFYPFPFSFYLLPHPSSLSLSTVRPEHDGLPVVGWQMLLVLFPGAFSFVKPCCLRCGFPCTISSTYQSAPSLISFLVMCISIASQNFALALLLHGFALVNFCFHGAGGVERLFQQLAVSQLLTSFFSKTQNKNCVVVVFVLCAFSVNFNHDLGGCFLFFVHNHHSCLATQKYIHIFCSLASVAGCQAKVRTKQ